jgi:hypothetical protein
MKIPVEKRKSTKTTCQICKGSFSTITDSHTKTHGVSLSEYKLLFDIDDNPHSRCQFSSNDNPVNQCNFKALQNSTNQLCILHEPNENKDIDLFSQFFMAHIKIHFCSQRDIVFSNVHFPITIKFESDIVEVENRLSFVSSTFHKGIDFSKKTFKKRINFEKCIIKGTADFSKTKFVHGANFGRSKFQNEAIFEDATFEEGAGFWRTEFHDNTTFLRTRFREYARFMTSTFPVPPKYIRFMNTHFDKPTLVLFADLDLSGTLFRWTDLTELKFENVRWPITSKYSGARRYIADEFFDWKNDKKHSPYSIDQYFDYVQDVYQQLKRNFEERRSHAEAGDFFYGEMECRRKASYETKYLPTWINLYRISSGYGQRYIRAGFILLLLVMIFATSHMLFGLQATTENSEYSKIHYSTKLNFSQSKSYFDELMATTIYCIEVLTRQEEHDRLFKPITIWGEALNVAFSIIVYVQTLFFVLALRRHFTR